jgi:hypothetical protein
MSDTGNVAKSLRDRLGGNADDRLGRALSELLENPLLTGAIGRAFDAREKAAQAQEVAMGALNLPSAQDIERLTRRLRAVSHRLEGIEDGVDRLDRALTPSGVEARLVGIETQLAQLSEKVDTALRGGTRAGRPGAARPGGTRSGTSRSGGRGRASRAGARTAATDKKVGAAKAAKAARGGRTAKATRAAKAAKTPGARSRANKPAPGKV